MLLLALAALAQTPDPALAAATARIEACRAERRAAAAMLTEARAIAADVKGRTDKPLRRYLLRPKLDARRFVARVDAYQGTLDLQETCALSAGDGCGPLARRANRDLARMRRAADRTGLDEARALADLAHWRPVLRSVDARCAAAREAHADLLDRFATHEAVPLLDADGVRELRVPRTTALSGPLRTASMPDDPPALPDGPGLVVVAPDVDAVAARAVHDLGWTGPVATLAAERAEGEWSVVAYGAAAANALAAVGSGSWAELVLVTPHVADLPVDVLTNVDRVTVYVNPQDRNLPDDTVLGAGGAASRTLARVPGVDVVLVPATAAQVGPPKQDDPTGLWRDIAGVLARQPAWERALVRRGSRWAVTAPE